MLGGLGRVMTEPPGLVLFDPGLGGRIGGLLVGGLLGAGLGG